MVGNNSSGTTSIKYGTTRDRLLSLKTLLSDGSEVEFKTISAEEFQQKTNLDTLEGKIYKQLHDLLSPPEVQQEIRENFHIPISTAVIPGMP